MDYGARFYSPGIGRFISADTVVPGAGNPQTLNRFSYTLNNPLKFVDPSGHYSYEITFRSFAPFDTFGGGFYGDGSKRGFTSSSSATARITYNLTVDANAQTLSDTVINSPSHHDLLGEGHKDGRGGWETVWYEKGQDIASADIKTSYHGANGLTPGFSPEIDADIKLSVVENKKDGYLYLSGSAIGDNFPATEAFIKDSAGTSIFLGIGYYDTQGGNKETAPFLALPGSKNQRAILEFGFYVLINDKGNFKMIWDGSKYISITDWNARFTKCNPHNKDSCK